MSRDALKFTDLAAFLAVMVEMGYEDDAKALIYEKGRLPYCSAFFVPTELLPIPIDQTTLARFGGRITQIQNINFLGTEEFVTDFMIFPLSLTGYLEVETTFAQATLFDDPEGRNMNFIINIEDGGGKEFYLAQGGNLVGLSDATDEEPQIFKTAKQANKQMELLRQKHSEACQVYALERHEFDARRKDLRPGQPE